MFMRLHGVAWPLYAMPPLQLYCFWSLMGTWDTGSHHNCNRRSKMSTIYDTLGVLVASLSFLLNVLLLLLAVVFVLVVLQRNGASKSGPDKPDLSLGHALFEAVVSAVFTGVFKGTVIYTFQAVVLLLLCYSLISSPLLEAAGWAVIYVLSGWAVSYVVCEEPRDMFLLLAPQKVAILTLSGMCIRFIRSYRSALVHAIVSIPSLLGWLIVRAPGRVLSIGQYILLRPFVVAFKLVPSIPDLAAYFTSRPSPWIVLLAGFLTYLTVIFLDRLKASRSHRWGFLSSCYDSSIVDAGLQ